MRLAYSIASLFALCLLISGCARILPVYNVTDSPVVTASGKQPTLAEVKQAIKTAAQDKGWLVQDVAADEIEATIHVRQHTAVVSIGYSPTSYRITYKDSEMLLYDGGSIHRNYNKWIQLLEQRINLEMNKL